MSGRKRAREALNPSLFPFLAVLLCTMGSLVLILMLVVSQARASANHEIAEKHEQTAELQAQVAAIRDLIEKDRETLQLEIEKKRLVLQALEKQTDELQQELEKLARKAELIDEQGKSDEESFDDKDSAISELEKQLADAAEQLKKKLDKPEGEKPVFAIIPYEGTNGTHRRPIYLECRANGIVIQPEGVLIPLTDLRPPYGPGNPLDAALRSIRSHYAPSGSALHSAAYPLLVVRESGVRTYALARMAMSGWDDQFGYELIEDGLDLAYPDGDPQLGKQVEQALVKARDRQAALVAAMPLKYRRHLEQLNSDSFEFSDAGGGGAGGAAGGWGDGDENWDDAGVAAGTAGAAGSSVDPWNALSGEAGGGSGRGGFSAAPPSSLAAGTRDYPTGGGQSGLLGFASGGSAGSPTGMRNGMEDSSYFSPPGGAQSATGSGSFAESAFGAGQYARGGGGAASSGGSGAGTQDLDWEIDADSSDFRDNAGGQAGGGGQPGSGSTSGSTTANASSGAQGSGTGQGTSTARSTASSNGGGYSSGNMSTESGAGDARSGANSASQENAGQVSAAEDMSPNGSPMLDIQRNKKQTAQPIARTRGRDWAYSGSKNGTPVVRTIRMTIQTDRWIVQPDQYSKDRPVTIMLEAGPQKCSEELAKLITGRVEGWGYALAGGHWKPMLEVEVTPGAERRFDQLVRLLEGSGLEVRLITK
jgi:hypothetical protein